MDFRDSPEEAVVRQRLRRWLDENLPRNRLGFLSEGKGIDDLTWWQAKLNEGNWAGLTWPKEYGGRGASPTEQAIFFEEMVRVRAPQPTNLIGMYIAGPTIIAHGTDRQKEEYLPRILSGEDVWCQGFSEPDAGSDLAGLGTRAILDGESFVVNGQKVWTSFAQFASWCILLARTDPHQPKHRGLTLFALDMQSPGIEIRPLRHINGEAEFSEMFLTDVRISPENVLGEVNDGWRTATTTLMHERATLGLSLSTEARVLFYECLDLFRTIERNGELAINDPYVRQELATLYLQISGLWLFSLRLLAQIKRTGTPGPEGSLAKLIWSESMKRLTDLVFDVLGPAALLDSTAMDDDIGRWSQLHLWYRGATILGGTSEILRNLIAERVLGLPKQIPSE